MMWDNVILDSAWIQFEAEKYNDWSAQIVVKIAHFVFNNGRS